MQPSTKKMYIQRIEKKLITTVESYPQIYSKQHELHKDRNAINNSWKTISLVMNIPGKHFLLLPKPFVNFHL